MTTTVVLENLEIQVPHWVVDLESFREWGRSDDFPDKGPDLLSRVKSGIDTTMEQLFPIARSRLSLPLSSEPFPRTRVEVLGFRTEQAWPTCPVHRRT